MGAVLRPRVYRVAEGARVRDLIERAGGLAPEADIADVNLAARLIDGTTLTIGARRVAGQRVIGEDTGLNPSAYLHSGHGVDYAPAPLPAAAGTDTPDAEIGGGAGIAKKPKAPSGPVNLNTADAEALATLPGIGPALASRIVAYRTQQAFSSVEDLAQVPGIGPKKLDAVRAYATVE